jgi:hypothetical protein
MDITKIELSDKKDKILIVGTNGAYTVTAEQIANLLIEDGQMCETCHDDGEISTDESDGEGHIMRGVGSAPCPDCRGRHDDE